MKKFTKVALLSGFGLLSLSHLLDHYEKHRYLTI